MKTKEQIEQLLADLGEVLKDAKNRRNITHTFMMATERAVLFWVLDRESENSAAGHLNQVRGICAAVKAKSN